MIFASTDRTALLASVALVLASVFLFTACGGGDDSPAPTTTGEPTASSTTSSTTSATDPVEPDAAAVDEITDAFLRFFDGAGTSLDEKVALLENGETYRVMLEAASANEQFQTMTADVRDVRFLDDAACASADESAPCALVTHDLLVGDFPMAAAIESAAVLVDGHWLVAASTWCGVVEIGGASCP